jgi:hypothetical protein
MLHKGARVLGNSIKGKTLERSIPAFREDNPDFDNHVERIVASLNTPAVSTGTTSGQNNSTSGQAGAVSGANGSADS